MADKPWYDYSFTSDIGTPDPYGGFPKPDLNFQVPENTPITALYGGVVSGIDTAGSSAVPPYGHVVTVRLHQPLNGLATHTAYLHLSKIAPGITVGSQVRTGDIIGYGGSGSSTPPGTQPASVGFALYSGDYYGQGSAWLNETSANLAGALNPVPIIDAARGDLAGLLGGEQKTYQQGLSSLNPVQPIIDYLNQNVPLFAIRIGLFILALLLVIFGFWILTRNPVADINNGISTAANTATKAIFL